MIYVLAFVATVCVLGGMYFAGQVAADVVLLTGSVWLGCLGALLTFVLSISVLIVLAWLYVAGEDKPD